ncbi:MAG: hypothetical protein A2542_01005 [Parcubacteria group bacterium RIFOXYD2_FULL_52_8]|nr:MAG: hypothetical protein A2542_01005 [Parcubacteria group bacterium RIFOXYD2_FULL_52_8]
MFILTVIPIARGIFKEELTYFTADEVPVGALIRVPVRGKTIHALVLRTESAREQKAALKAQAFTVKKIAAFESSQFFHPAFVQACELTADYFAQHTGTVLAIQVPRLILAHAEKMPSPTAPIPAAHPQTYLLQEPKDDRMRLLKRQIRERFAKGQSILLIEPTIAHIEALTPEFEKGIEQYTLVLHGSQSDRETLRNWKKAVSEEHPVLVIATPYFFALPVARLGCIIIDQEHSAAYKTIGRPAFDERVFARFYAKAAGIDLVLADRLLSLETLHEHEAKSVNTLSPLTFHSQSRAHTELLNMRRPEGAHVSTPFEVIGEALTRAIEATVRERSQMFLFVQRKGLAPLTYCEDCETIVACPECAAPLVLQTRTHEERYFRCTHCSFQKKVENACLHCGSWRFRMLGIGSEKVQEELKRLFPTLTLFQLDADRVRSHDAAQACVQDFVRTPSALLMGTEMALYYLHDQVPRVGVVSLDALFSLPHFRVREKLMHLLLCLRDLATQELLIQTRKADDSLFDFFLRDDTINWYKEELEERRAFHYPPATVFVKVSVPKATPHAEAELLAMQAATAPHQSSLFHTKSGKGAVERLNLLVRFPLAMWPHEDTVERLRHLTPQYVVEVDPESLL